MSLMGGDYTPRGLAGGLSICVNAAYDGREQPGTYRKIADRVHRLKVGQHFDVQGVGTDEGSRNRFRSGLYAAVRLDKVSVRGRRDGSVRVTKVGEWSSVNALVALRYRTLFFVPICPKKIEKTNLNFTSFCAKTDG